MTDTKPETLTEEGRRLVAAYHDAYAGWRRESIASIAASDRREPWEVIRALEDVSDAACGLAADATAALTAFVLKASGRATLPAGRGDVIDLDLWPAAAVDLDGALWVAYQDQDGKPGELLLTHLVLADVVKLPEKGGDA